MLYLCVCVCVRSFTAIKVAISSLNPAGNNYPTHLLLNIFPTYETYLNLILIACNISQQNTRHFFCSYVNPNAPAISSFKILRMWNLGSYDNKLWTIGLVKGPIMEGLRFSLSFATP